MGIFKKKKATGSVVKIKQRSYYAKKKLIGLMLVAVAMCISFIVVPMLSNMQNATKDVLVANHSIKSGQIINKSDVKLEKRGIYGYEGIIDDDDFSVGKIAVIDIAKGDLITENKIGSEKLTELQKLKNEGKTLVSVTAISNASVLSQHLQKGDIVRIYSVTGSEYGKSVYADPLLDSMEVYDLETADGISVEDVVLTEDKEVASLTLICNSIEQERALIAAEYNGSVHVAFKR